MSRKPQEDEEPKTGGTRAGEGSEADGTIEIDGDALLAEGEDLFAEAAEAVGLSAAGAAAEGRQDETPEAGSEEEGGAPAESAEVEELRERWLRARADLENYRRRTERERGRMRTEGVESVARALLPVLDDLDRALAAESDESGLRQGVELIARSLLETLSGFGLEVLPAEGEVFDPEVHEAGDTRITTEAPAQTVIAVLRKGYRLGERVLRPTLVRVALAPEAEVSE